MIINPCISICKTDPVTGFCYGCARTEEEKNIWKNKAKSLPEGVEDKEKEAIEKVSTIGRCRSCPITTGCYIINCYEANTPQATTGWDAILKLLICDDFRTTRCRNSH